MKKLGIIGGMGPKATSVFFDNIVNKTVAQFDHEHIEIVLLNSTRLQEKTKGIRPELDELLYNVKLLESLGVSNIAMPCNTAHIFIGDMQKCTSVPIINMIEETAKHIKRISKKENAKVAVLATDTTIKSGLYQNALSELGMAHEIPDESNQFKIMSIIYDQVKKTGAGNIADLNTVLEQMKALKCDYVILGCTELSWFTYNFPLPDFCVDALEILTRVSIERSGGKYKQI